MDGSLGRQPKERGKRSREAAEQRRKVTSLLRSSGVLCAIDLRFHRRLPHSAAPQRPNHGRPAIIGCGRFGTGTLVLDTGKLVAGTTKDEDAMSLTQVTPSNETMRIARNSIDEQSATTSAMPAMTRALTLREIRDLTEYLSTLTTRSEPK